MPGKTAPFSDPDSILKKLEQEREVKDMELLREIVTKVWEPGSCQVRDANTTRALAINTVATKGRRTHEFFAVLTDNYCLKRKKDVGPQGFSIQVAFREGAAKPSGSNWVSDRYDYTKKSKKGNIVAVWWRNELRDAVLDVNSIVEDAKKARETFLSE
jgi:hypothetical protein